MPDSNTRFGQAVSTYFSGKRILITGGGGYIATNLLLRLRDADCRIARLARPGAALETETGTASIVNLYGDVRDRSTWEQALQEADIVFHLAAQTSTYAANDSPIEDYQANVVPMLLLLETCRGHRLRPTVLFSGTVTAVGIPASLPVDESHADHPITVYDLHKLMAETYLKYYAEHGLTQGVILRLSNVYGPGPRNSRSDRGILNAMIRIALNGEDLTVYGDGHYLRDYVYVDDVIQAFLLAAENARALNGRHFVISTGKGHMLADAARLVAERVALKTGKKVHVRHVPPPETLSPIETRNFVGNPRRFSEATGWIPSRTLADGIDRTIEAMS